MATAARSWLGDRAVEAIVGNTAPQGSMIRALLDMSSLLNGRLRRQVTPLDLRGVVEEAVPDPGWAAVAASPQQGGAA